MANRRFKPLNAPVSITGSAFGDLSDVDLTGAAAYDMLYYDGASWVDTAGRLTWTGSEFRVYDATLADYLSASHNGTEVVWANTNTARWNINSLTDGIKINDGAKLYLYDSAGTDYGQFYNDGTDFHNNFVNTGTVIFENNTADFFVLDFTNDRWIAYAPMFMQEQAAANADTASFGQLWVKNDTPNTLWFTDDAGTDHQLGVSGGASALPDLSDVTITAAATGDILRYNGSAWVDYPDSNYAAASHSHAGSDITSGSVAPTVGGTGITTYTTGDILYASATNTLSKLAAGTSGYVLTMGASVPAWSAASGSSTQTKYKTSAETVTNSTTLQDDDHITGFTLEAGAKYKVEGWFYWLSNSTTTDIKFAMSFTNTPVTQVWMGHGATSSNGSIAGEYTSMAGNLICQSIAGTNAIQVAGYIAANGTTGGTCKLQWAQNTAAFEDTDLYAGSWLSLTKIS